MKTTDKELDALELVGATEKAEELWWDLMRELDQDTEADEAADAHMARCKAEWEQGAAYRAVGTSRAQLVPFLSLLAASFDLARLRAKRKTPMKKTKTMILIVIEEERRSSSSFPAARNVVDAEGEDVTEVQVPGDG